MAQGKFMQRSEGDNMEFSLSLGEGGGGGGGDGSEFNAELEKLSGWIARYMVICCSAT